MATTHTQTQTQTQTQETDLTQFYPWHLSETSTPDDAPEVVSTFSCGGGSTMGYKLAGFSPVGAVDIDPVMMEAYAANLDTPNQLTMGVGDVVSQRPDLIEQWQDIDVLDGSPPCTLFSIARKNAQEDWGKLKKFREGQTEQILDRLFFDYLDLVNATRAKVFVAENVATMAHGQTKGYVKAVVETAKEYGYKVQVFKTRAVDHGVPQIRNRLFFLGIREDLASKVGKLPPIKPTGLVTPGEAMQGLSHDCEDPSTCQHVITSKYLNVLWESMQRFGDPRLLEKHNYKFFDSGQTILTPHRPVKGITSSGHIMHASEQRKATEAEMRRIFSFPDDYVIPDETISNTIYLLGMSVPPLLMRAVAAHVKTHWIDRL